MINPAASFTKVCMCYSRLYYWNYVRKNQTIASATDAENFERFGHVAFEIREIERYKDRQIRKQIYRR